MNDNGDSSSILFKSVYTYQEWRAWGGQTEEEEKDSGIKGIEAFEMWCYLRMTSTYWIQKVTNEQALINILEQERLSKRYRRLSWFRNILRHETPRRVLEDKI